MQKSFLLGSLLLVLAGCADTPMQPLDGMSGSNSMLSANSGADKPTFVSNRTKYRDEGKKPSTGRDGMASMTVRALLGKDNKVDVDITTGTPDALDSKSGPGNLDKVQLKVFDTYGNNLSTQNYNRLRNGGFASYSLSNLPRQSQIQVQANISGIDPKRVGVVTVTDAVKLRPDLKAAEISVPTHVAPDVPVTIAATVREINGDVGARADCVLSIAGSEVDRASGIWVDAGGNVNCAFTHKFTSPGVKSIKVEVAKVLPADYDASNNSVTGSVEVSSNFRSSGSVSDMEGESYSKYYGWNEWSTDGGATYSRRESSSEYSSKGRAQSATQYGFANQALKFPIQVSVRQATEGREIVNRSFTWAAPDYSWYSPTPNSDYGCASRSILEPESGQTFVSVCTASYAAPEGGPGTSYAYTTVSQLRFAGEVTYASRWHSRVWYQGEETCENYGCWSSNYSYTYKAGLPLSALGQDYTLSIAASDGDVSLFSSVKVPLQPLTMRTSYPSDGRDPCYRYEGQYKQEGSATFYYRGENCGEGYYNYSGVTGFASSQ